jgi:hypothetical protein
MSQWRLAALEPDLGRWSIRVVTNPRLPRPSSRRRVTAAAVAGVIAVVLVTIGLVWREQQGPSRLVKAGTTGVAASPDSRTRVTPASISGLPLGGVPLQRPTGLRLLVADTPAPFILDVDRGTVQAITGLPTEGERGISVLRLGKDALVLSFRFCNGCRGGSAYLLRHGSTVATRLGRAQAVVPARDGHGVWKLTSLAAGQCAIRKATLGGRPRRVGPRVSCRTVPVAELPAGLLTTFTGRLGMNAHSALLGPDGSVVRFRDPYAQPVVGNLVLSGADRSTPLLLHDIASGASHKLRWPSRPHYGLGEITGQPNGRLATVNFAKYSPEHRSDLWLLDTTTRRWQHLPGMPAPLVPKATHVEWTPDGRVVIMSGNVLGVWRPGETRLAISRVKPPKQPGIEFVIW